MAERAKHEALATRAKELTRQLVEEAKKQSEENGACGGHRYSGNWSRILSSL